MQQEPKVFGQKEAGPVDAGFELSFVHILQHEHLYNLLCKLQGAWIYYGWSNALQVMVVVYARLSLLKGYHIFCSDLLLKQFWH